MSDSTIPLKTCTKCGQSFPATREYFYAHKRGKYGLHAYCKACEIQRTIQYGKEHPEQKRQRDRRWRENNLEKARAIALRIARADPDKKREQNRRWRHNNPEKAREHQRRYRTSNSDKLREDAHLWRVQNPDKNAAKQRNRIARKRSAEGTHTAEDVQRQYERQQGLCFYCQCKLTDVPYLPNSQTVDHVVPLTRGGSNDPSNLVIACSFCNSSKGDKLLHEWDRNGGRLL